MDEKKVIIEQIKIVIGKLEIEYSDEIASGIMQLIYKRYKNALDILENNKDINRMVEKLTKCFKCGIINLK